MIKTYIPFVESINLVTDRDKVSAELAKILFEVVHTGYVKSNGDGTNDNSPSILMQQIEKFVKP